MGADWDLCYHGRADHRLRHCGPRSAAPAAGERFRGRARHPLGVALILAAFRVDVPMLSGGSPATWHGWVHGIAFLLIIAMGVLAPLAMAVAVRGNAGWRPIGVISVAAGGLFVVFLFLPWGNASFLMAIITLFAWIAAIAVRLATYQQSLQDRQAK
jgi:hypothetical protein